MNTSKTKILVLGALATAMLFTSCSDDFLEIQKPDGEPLNEYYKNQERIEESLCAAYDPTHWPDWCDMTDWGFASQYNPLNCDADIMSDDFWVGGGSLTDQEQWQLMSNFSATADKTLKTLWTIDYMGVKRCNDALTYLGYAELPDDYRAKAEAQARGLRVYYYNMLWHYFGNIPFFLNNLSSPFTATQYKADEVYDKLIVELEELIDQSVLPVKWDDENAGRVSQSMLVMMYAEMVAYQNDEDRLPKALAYLKQYVIGQFSLYPDFAALWDEEGEWCSESIWEINYNQTNSERDWGLASINVGGTVLPTLISPYQWPGGDGWGEDGAQEGWGFLPMRRQTAAMFEEGDTRRDGTVWDVTGFTYTNRLNDTHLWLKKYRPYDKTNANASSSKNLNYNNNYRYYRYAEALLYAAEFSLRTGGSTADAKNYVNEVRRRAGIAELQDVTIDDVFTERHKEFVGEGKRYFDLVRAEGVSGVSSANKASTVLTTENGDAEGSRYKSWTPNKKFIPIAQEELDSDQNLVQNEDYFKN